MNYAFGPFRLDATEQQLRRGDHVLPLTAKAFDVLHLLVRNAGRTVTKEEFMSEVWAGTVVEEANLTDNISTLRQALEDDAREPKYIQTVPKRGYRFVAGVHTATSSRRWPWIAAAAVAVVIIVAILSARMLLRRAVPKSQARSLAVLPFKPLVAGDRDAAMELGMTDALIAKLSRIREIEVRPTTAVMPYVEGSADLREIAAKLDVEAVLDGKLQKSGDRMRVSVQLVRAEDGATLWADRFDERFTDIFALQDAISERVAAALAVRLTAGDRDLLARQPTSNVEAYQLYLNGFHHWRSFRTDGLLASINYFNAALKLDPQFAPAWAGLARSYSVLGIQGPLAARDAFPKAQEAVNRALELDPDLPDAHVVKTAVKICYERDWEGVRREIETILRLDPGNGEAHGFRGYYLKAMGRPEEAVAELDRALAVSPEWTIAKNDAALARLHARRYDETIRRAQQELALDPNQLTILRVLGLAYAAKGDHERALAIYERLRKVTTVPCRVLSAMAWSYAKTGRRGEALALIEETKKDSSPWMPFEVAKIYAGLGDRDQAFAWLERARVDGMAMLWEVRVRYEFDDLRDDPRYAELLRALNLPV